MREVKLDSSKMLMDSKETSANAERYPLFSKEATLCHADKSARNDRKRGFFKQDSRSCGGTVDFHRLQRILGFCDDFGGFQGSGKGAYLGYVTADTAAESTKRAQKPNPPARN